MDERFMLRALELANTASGHVAPNPLVGAVIVKDHEIIGEGCHEQYGFAHAEVNALKNASERGNDVAGAEMYVTLEPCSHYGKQPPCALAIVEHKIKRVYVGAFDINPKVAGKGIKILRDNGIEVVEHVCEEKCRRINQSFFKFISTGLPYVTIKAAMSMDGKIATYTGSSKWITNEKSRAYAHHLRNDNTAIMAGINTVLIDNPQLNCRASGGVSPIKIIVDSTLKIPLDANVLTGEKCIILTSHFCDKSKKNALEKIGAEVIVVEDSTEHNVNLKKAMKLLGEKRIDSILLEGGGTLNEAALGAGIVDRCLTFIAPKIIGGKNALTPVEGAGIEDVNNAYRLIKTSVKELDGDYMIDGYLNWY